MWNSAVKGFSCGHLSGRDIMILQLNTESWDLFISTNSSPRCAEHIKYHGGTKKRKKRRSTFPSTIITDLLIVSQQWQATPFTWNSTVKNNAAALSLCPLKAAFIPARWHPAFQRWLRASSDQLQIFINKAAFGIINSKWFFRLLSVCSLSQESRPLWACKGVVLFCFFSFSERWIK